MKIETKFFNARKQFKMKVNETLTMENIWKHFREIYVALRNLQIKMKVEWKC